MMFDVELGGGVRTVAIEPADRPGRFRVTLDGEPQLVDVVRAGQFGLSLLRTVPGESGTLTVSSDLHVCPGRLPGELLVWLGGRVAGVTINGRSTRRPGDAGAPAAGDLAIVAPMPGRVVRVLVADGEEVAPRQAIVVVEAMKMENELRTPRAGRVKEIWVTPGMSVEAGRVLAVIE